MRGTEKPVRIDAAREPGQSSDGSVRASHAHRARSSCPPARRQPPIRDRSERHLFPSRLGAARRAHGRTGAVRDHPGLLGFASARRAGLRPGLRRPVRHPRRRQRRRAVAGGQRRVAASRFGTRLVVVMGHSQCGAITARSKNCRGHATTSRRTCALSSIAFARRWRRCSRSCATPIQTPCARGGARQRSRSVDHLRHGSDLLER